MPHIIILDENGNEIGYEDHGREGIADDDHEARTIVINLEAVAKGLGLKDKKDKD